MDYKVVMTTDAEEDLDRFILDICCSRSRTARPRPMC